MYSNASMSRKFCDSQKIEAQIFWKWKAPNTSQYNNNTMSWRNEITRDVITAVVGMTGDDANTGTALWVEKPTNYRGDFFDDLTDHIRIISGFIRKEFCVLDNPSFAVLLGIPIPEDVKANPDAYCFITITVKSIQPHLDAKLKEKGLKVRDIGKNV